MILLKPFDQLSLLKKPKFKKQYQNLLVMFIREFLSLYY